ncbi:MAG: DUF2116 family Zn-ribbon domain-containing protein [Bacteroidota bacterium]
MEKGIEKAHCLECGAPVTGRRDKVYCDDSCRTSFNNRKRQTEAAVEPEFLKVIPKIILGNYQILKGLNSAPLTKIKRSKLEKMGFNFGYITSTYVTKTGAVYNFCFDQGYLQLSDDLILLVQQDSQVVY